jgi:excisionase family DNA binding protein
VTQLRQYPAGVPALTDLRIRKYGARVSELLNTAEVAEILGVSDVTVGRLARSGELPEAKKNPGRTGSRVFDAAVVQLFKAHNSKRPRAQQRRRGQDALTTK